MNFVPRASHCELRSEMKVERNKRLYLICFKTLCTEGLRTNSQSEGLIGDKYSSYEACELLQTPQTQPPIEQAPFTVLTLISINVIKRHR